MPYTSAQDNKEYYTSSDDSSDDSEGSEEAQIRMKQGKRTAFLRQSQTRIRPPKMKKMKQVSLFYNFSHRDQCNWKKFHTIKMIYHKPSAIMFVFSNMTDGENLIKLMKKTYSF